MEKTFLINTLRQYFAREADQQTKDFQVCSVAVLDCTSENMRTEDNMEGLVESSSICDDESTEVLNINPDLKKEQQSQIRQAVTNCANTRLYHFLGTWHKVDNKCASRS